jgi:transcriptional regulator with GAF, ATPase, and Fis domain
MDSTHNTLLEVISRNTDTQTMMAKAMPLMVSYLGAENGSLMLLSGDVVVRKVLATKETFAQVSAHKVHTVLTEGLAGWVYRHRQGGLASHTALDERWVSMGDTAIASAMVVPLVSRNGVTGLLALHHSVAGSFRERDLAKAADLAQWIAPWFEMALLTESTIESLVSMCASAAHPSVVLDWQGDVKALNHSMEKLDIAWAGVNFSQSLLPRELGVEHVSQCNWDGARNLVSLPLQAHATPFRGIGAWIQLMPRTKD